LTMIMKAQQCVRLFATMRFRNQISFASDGATLNWLCRAQNNADGVCAHWLNSQSLKNLLIYY
jgi:hypothetical protein